MSSILLMPAENLTVDVKLIFLSGFYIKKLDILSINDDIKPARNTLMVTTKIRKKIKRRGPGSLWSPSDFTELPYQAVAQTFSRLARSGELERVQKGIYFYPKKTALGRSQPSGSALLTKIIGKKGRARIYSAGMLAFQNLGLTEQVPAQITLVSNQARRKVKIGNQTIKVLQRSLEHLSGASQEDFWILEVLRNLKSVPGSTPVQALQTIMVRFIEPRIGQLVVYARGEPPRVRALVGAIAEHLGLQTKSTARLKALMNPASRYQLGVSSVLPTAGNWNIT